MAKLADRVIYRVHEEHRTQTTVDNEEIKGSVHHPEMREFAGMVARVHGKKTADLIIFVPGREHKWIDRAEEGTGPHTFTVVDVDFDRD